MKIGEKLLYLRQKHKLSQEQLASRITVSRQAVSRWELGEALPDTANIVQLAKVFGVTTDYLLNDEADLLPVYTAMLTEDDAVSSMLNEIATDESDVLAKSIRADRINKKGSVRQLAPIAACVLIFVGIILVYVVCY